jgi:hypothetical protein
MAIFEGLESDSDRAAAIIAGSMIDVRLEAALRHRMRRDAQVEATAFDARGPLGTFANKIDMAYLMGIISKEAREDIHVVRGIRNSFAHDLSVKDFQCASIRDRTSLLRLVETHALSTTADVPDQFIINTQPGAIPRIGVVDLLNKKQNSRERYMITCSIVTAALSNAELHTDVEII